MMNAPIEELANVIHTRETTISFEELYEKLLNCKMQLATMKNTKISL